MFKTFHGFHLVDRIHKRNLMKKRRNLPTNAIKIAIITALTLLVAFIPTETFHDMGLKGLTVVQHRVIALFVFAALMWLTEALASWVTSMIVVVIMLLTVSNSAFSFLASEEYGEFVKYADIMHCFANPTIMLFIGGFVLAIGMTKTKLDVVLARVLLKPFGTKSETVLLGFILVTALFSAFVSNTATAAMMLAFLGPVLRSLPADGKGRVALALAIPVGANLGGIMTPIGTPPNLIVLDNLNKFNGIDITFPEWMMRMTPFVIILLFISWFLLKFLFPFKQKTINLVIEGEAKKDWRSIIVYITFAVTVLLWVTDKVTGVNSNVVALLPVAVFAGIGVITRRDLEEINWAVLWMVAGGFALGVALNETGLAANLINSIPFNSWPVMAVLIGSGLICYTLSNFISNTATAALLVPILAVVGKSMTAELAPIGGVACLLIGIAVAASVAMILPISTPPNALAHGTGMIEQKYMAKSGLIMGIIGLVLGYGMLVMLGSIGFFG